MDELETIASRMREDWDRRVSHDYRFWMSDGYSDDAHMWSAGERDFGILTEGIPELSNKTVLDVGCGVGRLLKSASAKAKKVIGIDVSSEAIAKAHELLGASSNNLTLHLGNGVDLAQVEDSSVDLVMSFAALCSIPTSIVGNYLREMHRVLRDNGVARLQFYLGNHTSATNGDTLHLRCYAEEHARAAFEAAGFEVEWINELKLPFQVSYDDLGILAVIVSIRKSAKPAADAATISEALLPGGEPSREDAEWNEDLEVWMSVNYARELLDKNDLEKARATLEYAEALSKTASVEVKNAVQALLEEERNLKKMQQETARVDSDSNTIGRKTIGSPATQSQSAQSERAPDILKNNLAVLADRFPEVHAELKSYLSSDRLDLAQVNIQNTQQGDVILEKGQCLDHPEKPQAAADTWVKRTLQEEGISKASALILVGVASGYHLSKLCQTLQEKKLAELKIGVIEPSITVLAEALKLRDQSDWLSKIDQLWINDSPNLSLLGESSELKIRPQTQAVWPEFCAKIRSRFYGQRGMSLLHPTFGVVGPLQGGTLPMVEYCSRGLLSLSQRMRSYDLSCFDHGYKHLERFVTNRLKRRSIENTYCEMVSQVVLESINEKPIDILFCMALAPISPRVLTEARKRGIITVLWFVEDYVRFTYWKEVASYFDFVFTIQRGKCINAIKQAGAGEVHYLPVGCDPIAHTPPELTEEERKRWGSPVSFMGAGYHNRQQLFASLADLPLKIWGTEWPTCRPFDRLVQEDGRRLSPAEYVKVFAASDININLHSSTERDGVDPFGDFLNPRTFELACAGAFQLVDRRSLLSEVFEEGKEIVTFNSTQDLKEKISYFLEHPEERRAIAERAKDKVLKNHTYAHRLQEMLSVIYSSKFESIRSREQTSPWKRVLERSKPHPELHQRCLSSFQRGEEPNLDGLISDIVSGKGSLTETERKLLFLYHVRKQIIRMHLEEAGEKE